MKKLNYLYWRRKIKLNALYNISSVHPDGDYTETFTELLELQKEIQKLLIKKSERNLTKTNTN